MPAGNVATSVEGVRIRAQHSRDGRGKLDVREALGLPASVATSTEAGSHTFDRSLRARPDQHDVLREFLRVLEELGGKAMVLRESPPRGRDPAIG